MKFYYTPQAHNYWGAYCWVYFLNRFGQVVTIGRVRKKKDGSYEYATESQPRWWKSGAKTREKAAILLWEAWLDAELDSALGHLHNLTEGSSRGHSRRLDRVRSWLNTWKVD